MATNIVIDKQTGPAESDLFHTTNYANDAACIQAALDKSKSGDTITIHEGNYYITKIIYQNGKNLKIIGEGKVIFHMKNPEKETYGILFRGSLIANKKLNTNANKGSSQVVLTDASRVRKNDLIKIWKNVKWCPHDYSDQMTGEIYAVKNVNGNVVTLNQPLHRDYKLSENVKVEVYRPIQMNIKNIRIQGRGATTSHRGLAMQYCKDSSITNSWFKDIGFSAICLYSCFNVNINNNEIYNSLLPGSGYGVNVASGSAFVNIDHNHIENCRHAITGNTAERKSLNRDVFITDNTLIGGNIDGSSVVDSHPVTISYVVTKNKIYPQPGFFAFSDGTQYSTFSNNKIFGGYGGISRRGSINDGIHSYENNKFNGMSGIMYLGGKSGINNKLIIKNNVQNNGIYGIYFPGQESFRNIIISGNSFSNLSHKGVYQKFRINGVNLNISNNRFTDIKLNGIHIDGNSFKSNIVKIQNNILINVYPPNLSYGIIVKNVQNAIITGNKISKTQKPSVPVATFYASPKSGTVPLSVKFTDKSTGKPTKWKWSFGDGKSSTAKNPTHKYSKAGKYTVKLTVTNAAGSNTAMKSKYIIVTAKPVAVFYASPKSGKVPLSVKFTDKSTGKPTKWKWSFGDGTYSTAQNPTHKYSKKGKYTVKLTVASSAGSNTATKTTYIKIS
ncbi:PKD domain-containing protein [Methanosarcina barkeri]|uniref:PKD domain-containing protein n=1 Tax=Methanosarcina barkeri TaxID=2208 RepID=UPI001E5924F1|nr:PKD domain-containing protein [Methanosarcina barkeri]